MSRTPSIEVIESDFLTEALANYAQQKTNEHSRTIDNPTFREEWKGRVEGTRAQLKTELTSQGSNPNTLDGPIKEFFEKDLTEFVTSTDNELTKGRDAMLDLRGLRGTENPTLLDAAMISSASRYQNAKSILSGEKKFVDFPDLSLPQNIDKRREMLTICFALATDEQKESLKQSLPAETEDLTAHLAKVKEDVSKAKTALLKLRGQTGTSDKNDITKARDSSGSIYPFAQEVINGKKNFSDFRELKAGSKLKKEFVAVCYAIASEDQKARLRMDPAIKDDPAIAASLVIAAPAEEKQKLYKDLERPFIRENEEVFHQTILAHQSSETTSLASKIANLEIYEKSFSKLQRLNEAAPLRDPIAPDSVSTTLIIVRDKVSRLGKESRKEKIRLCVADIAAVVPDILEKSRPAVVTRIIERDATRATQEAKDKQLLLKHINRIARGALKKAGIDVKRTWKEAFQDVFASKKERDQVKAKMKKEGMDLRKILTKIPTEGTLYPAPHGTKYKQTSPTQRH